MKSLIKFILRLFFHNTIQKFREWKIKRYKLKKVKVESKNSDEKLYNIHFKIGISDKSGLINCNDVFNIQIPANGIFYAKKELEKFIIDRVNIEVIKFESE